MKQLIRLTEGDLHQIVENCVRKVMNEIGDTPRGQYMLGKLAARQLPSNTYKSANTSVYANKKFGGQPYTHSQDFDRGYREIYDEQ